MELQEREENRPAESLPWVPDARPPAPKSGIVFPRLAALFCFARAMLFRSWRRAFAAAALAFVAGINLWAWRHVHEAGRLVDQQSFSRAYMHYSQALQVWRWSASLHFLAARTARRARLYPQAEQHLAECQRLQGDATDAALPLALEHLLLQAQSGDVGTVEEALWRYVETNKPETPLILEALARGYLRMLRTGAAHRCLRLLLEREPDHVEALLMRAVIEESSDQTPEAREDYRRVLELDPERDDARRSLAMTLARDYPRQARPLFEQVLAHRPDDGEALLGLAQVLRALGEPEKARMILEAVLAKDPENSKALTKSALTLPAGETAEAERLLRKAIAADPTNHEAHYHLYLCLSRQPHREEEADAQIAIYERVSADMARLGQIATKEMTRTPNDANLHYEMGTIYLRYGKPDVGIRWLYSALKLEPTHQRSHQVLADYFARTGDGEKAAMHRARLRPTPARGTPGQP